MSYRVKIDDVAEHGERFDRTSDRFSSKVSCLLQILSKLDLYALLLIWLESTVPADVIVHELGGIETKINH
jgi:hypothetical protein